VQGAIRLLLVDDKIELRQNIVRLLSFEDSIEVVAQAGNGTDALSEARRVQPDVVLMDVSMPGLNGLETTEILSGDVPQASTVIMSVHKDREYMRRAMRVGALDYLVKPFAAAELVDTIQRAHELGIARRTPSRQELAQLPKSPQSPGKIITVFSGKGGVGKSTIAVNLAVAMRKLTGRNMCLLDANLQFGDIGMLLNIEARDSLAHLAEQPRPWSSRFVASHLVEHRPSGVSVMLAPARPELSELIEPEHVEECVRALAGRFAYVIVDTASMITEQELLLLECSDCVVVVVSLDMSSIKSAVTTLELFRRLEIPSEKIKVVLNRGYPAAGGLDVSDVQSSLHRDVDALIPRAGSIMLCAANKGRPVVLTDMQSEIAQSLYRLAKICASSLGESFPEQAEREGDSFFSRLKNVFSTG